MRRKLSKVELLLGSRAPRAKVVDYLLRAESVLARGKDAVEELKSARKEKEDTVARKPKSEVPGGKAAPSKKLATKKPVAKSAAKKKTRK
jgi:hypothetical protein